jgi:hypothetical protein
MQIRIRHLYRAAPETVQRATHAFAAPIENVGIDHVVILDSVPVGVPQRESTQRTFVPSVTSAATCRLTNQILTRTIFLSTGAVPGSSVGIIAVFVIGDFPDGRTLCWELRMKN